MYYSRQFRLNLPIFFRAILLKLQFYILFLFGILATGAVNAQVGIPPTVDTMSFTDTVLPDTSVGLIVDTSGKLPNADTVFATMKTLASDTLPPIKKLFEPNAKKAGMYASIFPGLGQVYNRQYWKIPIVYAILGTAGYFIGYNYNRYSKYREAYIYAIDGDPATFSQEYGLYDGQQLQRLQSSAKKDLDVLVLLTSVGYALQIMDAVASAHLRNFDVSRDISMQVKPLLQSNFVGVGLVMNFK